MHNTTTTIYISRRFLTPPRGVRRMQMCLDSTMTVWVVKVMMIMMELMIMIMIKNLSNIMNMRAV